MRAEAARRDIPVRIIVVNNFAHVTGGADQHCLELARLLRARGHEVALLSTASPLNEEHEGEFVCCSVTNETRDSLPPTRRLGVAARAIWNREAAAALRRLLREFRPDVVHLHKLYPQLSVAPAVVVPRSVAVVQTLHDYELVAASAFDHRRRRIDRDESRFSYRLLNSATFPLRRHLHSRRVDRFVAVSDWIAETHARSGIEAAVLPNFVAEEPLGDVLANEAEREGILFAGRLSREKGVLDLLALARRLPDVAITVAGDGPLYETVEKAADGLDNLRFQRRLERPALLASMRSAQLLVAPSHWHEPASLVALEAMSNGTPVVAYDRGGLAEYVRRAKAGLLVEPDAAKLAEACRELLSRPLLWRSCSQAGIGGIHRYHSGGRYLPRLEAIYREAMAATAGSRRAPRGPAVSAPAHEYAHEGAGQSAATQPRRSSSAETEQTITR